MLALRKSRERGHADHGWLQSRHSFSFANYFDPRYMGFRSLRVINEDRIQGGTGFDAHPHRDMEIISYVVEGALEHQDSMGTKTVIRPGEVQRMSAGTGVVHSEYNASADKETHFFQIWIKPSSPGGEPGYGQKDFSAALESNDLVLVASGDGRDGSISIKQDVDMYIARLKAGKDLEFALRKGRGLWLQVVEGIIQVDDAELSQGDGLQLENEQGLRIRALQSCELLLFDLA